MSPFSQNTPNDPALAVLNPEQMGILRDEGLLESLTVLFEEMAGSTIEAMAAALEAGDTRGLSSKAHLLKGSAVNFGADRLVAVCQELEQSAAGLEKPELQRLFEAIRTEYQLVSEALHAA